MLLELLVFFILLRSAYTDYKIREIEDKIHILLLLIFLLQIIFGVDSIIFNASLSERMSGVILPLVMLIFAVKKEGSIGGGDIKLLFCLGVLVGYSFITIILVVTLPFILVWSKIKNENKIPVATFVFVGYVVLLVLVGCS